MSAKSFRHTRCLEGSDIVRVLTTGGLLSYWARVQPAAPAIIDAFTGNVLSYSELNGRANGVATALVALGLEAGDVLAYVLSNPLDTIILVAALGKCGAVWSPLNARSRPSEWIRQLQHCQAKALVSDSGFEKQLAAVRASDVEIPVWLSWTQLTQPIDASSASLERGPDWDDLAGILYTSGTTGAPKGARHTHRTLWGWCESLLVSLGITRDDVILNPYPLFHMGGIGFTLTGLQVGATVILDTPFDPSRAVQSAGRFCATMAFMVPTMIQALLDLPATERACLTRLPIRQLISTSAPLMRETAAEMTRLCPSVSLSVLYSATEAVFTVLRHSGPPPILSVGQPAFGSEIAVLDRDGHRLSANGLGTIFVRGLSTFGGYHAAPGQFGAFRGAWLTCNDVGYQDETGDLYLVDRETDLINSGGEKISTLEIENVLRSHPGVREAGVVGVPDRYWGQRIHAAVVVNDPRLTEEALLAYAATRLARFKLPKSLAFVSELPKTDTGKILKRALRQMASEASETDRSYGQGGENG